MNYIPTRLENGKRLNLETISSRKKAEVATCLLCGSLLFEGEINEEHPLPKWLLRMTDTSEHDAWELIIPGREKIKRNDFTFKVHKVCNQAFGILEERTRPVIEAIAKSEQVRRNEVELVLDWLDKVRTVAHLTTLQSEDRLYTVAAHLSHFPNLRVGLRDRIAYFFKSDYGGVPRLSLINPQDAGFKSTPSSIYLRINNLCIVSCSDGTMLSDSFGLSRPFRENESSQRLLLGRGSVSDVVRERRTRIPAALAIYQPMRTLWHDGVWSEQSDALAPDGSGYIFIGKNNTIERAGRRIDFGMMPTIRRDVGTLSACVEVCEWILLSKRVEFLQQERYLSSVNKRPFWMKSESHVDSERLQLLNALQSVLRFNVSSEDNSLHLLSALRRIRFEELPELYS